MRILLDENVPAPLRTFFPDDQVTTVQQLGWAGIENGELISRAEAEFDVLILADKNLRYQRGKQRFQEPNPIPRGLHYFPGEPVVRNLGFA